MRHTHKGHGHTSHSKGKHSGKPSFHVICLSSGGGPSENNVTGFLVRSTATNWGKGSILAVDAGSHLSAITTILEDHFPRVSVSHIRSRTIAESFPSGPPSTDDSDTPCSSLSGSPEPQTKLIENGPFAGLSVPHESARANALWIVRECVSTYLITHPHLDHLSAFAINTAAFHNTSRPKRLAALPSTVNAIKTHIFNDIIWPNLTDEDGGVGFVTFQRLASGGNVAVGEGSGKGYMEVCDGLCVKGLKISHGQCTRGSDLMPKRGSDVGLSEATLSRASATGETKDQRRISISQASQTATEGGTAPAADSGYRDVVVDSTAYFIRDDHTTREILFFGDVEADSLSLNPRTLQVWTEAAPKIAHGSLKAILIECSYDDSQADSILFGHLAPRHLFSELQVLAGLVAARKAEGLHKRASKKRKLDNSYDTDASAPPTDDESTTQRSTAKRRNFAHAELMDGPMSTTGPSHGDMEGLSPRSHPTTTPRSDGHARGPLSGLTVIVIHVKDTLQDGPLVGNRILTQLQNHDKKLRAADGAGLGCDFVISEAGGSYWF